MEFSIQYYNINYRSIKKLRKEFFLSRDPCEESSGRADDGEDRPSWRSWQMILPPLQMQPSRPPHEEQGQ